MCTTQGRHLRESADQIARRGGSVQRIRDPPPVCLRRLHRHHGQRQLHAQRLVEIHHQAAAGTVPGMQVVQRAVVDDTIPDRSPPGGGRALDVGQVVRRRHDRGVAGRSQRREKRSDGLLAHHSRAQASARPGTARPARVEEGRGELATHPLTEATAAVPGRRGAIRKHRCTSFSYVLLTWSLRRGENYLPFLPPPSSLLAARG